MKSPRKGVRHQSDQETGEGPRSLVPVSKMETVIDPRFLIGVGGIYSTYLLYVKSKRGHMSPTRQPSGPSFPVNFSGPPFYANLGYPY